MSRNTAKTILFLVFAVLLTLTTAAGGMGAGPVMLVTDDEAARPDARAVGEEQTYLKAISIDITGRVREYITGTKLDVPDAEFPTGNHRALISINDVDGRVSSKLFYVTITKP